MLIQNIKSAVGTCFATSISHRHTKSSPIFFATHANDTLIIHSLKLTLVCTGAHTIHIQIIQIFANFFNYWTISLNSLMCAPLQRDTQTSFQTRDSSLRENNNNFYTHLQTKDTLYLWHVRIHRSRLYRGHTVAVIWVCVDRREFNYFKNCFIIKSQLV